MTTYKKTVCGLVLSSVFITGTAFASSDHSLMNTPNVDFNDIGNSLISLGFQKNTAPNGDILVGNNGDPLAIYSNPTGNWIYYNSN